jgi:enoyl-CoA hydratase/carnithine racemase
MSIQSEILNGVGLISLDRGEKANAYDKAHLRDLRAAFASLTERTRVVIIRSAHPRFFCAGADLDEMKEATPEDARSLLSQAVFTEIARSPAVTIAVVDGPAIAGGCELALACDLRVIGAGAVFRLPETSLGIIPAAGGCTRLSALLGASISKQVILGGGSISADEANRWGLGVDGGPDPMASALQWAQRLLSASPDALGSAKRIIDRAAEDRSLQDERETQAQLYAKRHS